MTFTPQVRVCAGLGRELCLVLVCLLGTGCVSKLFYYPTDEVLRTPAAAGLAYEEVTFTSEDGTALHGWMIPAITQPAKGTVIHFHGNAHNISGFFGYVHWLPEAGLNLFMFDYRGYGKSAGKPGRRGVLADSIAAIRHVSQRSDLDTSRLILLGQSLGGANALAAYGRLRPPGVRAIVVDSSFYSYRSIVRDKIDLIAGIRYLRWPLSYLLITDYGSPSQAVNTLAPIPLLVVHGTRDRVVPFTHAQRLYDEADEPKTLWRIEAGHHTDALTRPAFRAQLLAFLEDAVRETP